VFDNFSFNRALYEIMLKNIVERDRSQMTLRRIRIEWRKTKATNTHSEYVILMLFHCSNGCTNAPQCYVYTYIACPVRCSLYETSRFRMVIAFR